MKYVLASFLIGFSTSVLAATQDQCQQLETAFYTENKQVDQKLYRLEVKDIQELAPSLSLHGAR